MWVVVFGQRSFKGVWCLRVMCHSPLPGVGKTQPGGGSDSRALSGLVVPAHLNTTPILSVPPEILGIGLSYYHDTQKLFPSRDMMQSPMLLPFTPALTTGTLFVPVHGVVQMVLEAELHPSCMEISGSTAASTARSSSGPTQLEHRMERLQMAEHCTHLYEPRSVGAALSLFGQAGQVQHDA
jgi:hypothetical protein